MNRNTDFPRKRIYLDSDLQIIFGVTLITVFAFPGILLSPLVGFLADQYGRTRILVPSLMIFGVAGETCAFVCLDFPLNMSKKI